MAEDDTSADDSSIDELSQQIQQLSSGDRADLLKSVRDDQLSAYLDARGEYIDNLREEGLMPGYPEGPWSDYCREHPEDPICQRIVTGEQRREQLEKYQRVRGEFVDRLRESGLLSEDEATGAASREPMMAMGGASSMGGLGTASGLGSGSAGDLAGFDPGLGYTPDPTDPWPWPEFCWRFPWLCVNGPIPDPFPFPLPGPQPDPVPFAQGGGRTLMANAASRTPGMASLTQERTGLTPRPDGPFGGIPDPRIPDPFPPRDPCELAPWLPQCGGPGCPPICYQQPWHPFCQRCWGRL